PILYGPADPPRRPSFPTRRSSDLSRRESATKLARSLNAALAMDEGGTGSLRNHDLAWKMAYSPDADWIVVLEDDDPVSVRAVSRSEEHTSELQSRENLVCRLLLEE